MTTPNPPPPPIVSIACNLCKSSCQCYFNHCDIFLCHTPSCAAHTQYRLHDRILVPPPENASIAAYQALVLAHAHLPEIKTNPVVQFIDHVEDDVFNIFEVENYACAPNVQLACIGYDLIGRMRVHAVCKGFFETTYSIAPWRFTSPRGRKRLKGYVS